MEEFDNLRLTRPVSRKKCQRPLPRAQIHRIHLHSRWNWKFLLAVAVGFEPTVEFPQHALSRRAP